MEQSFSGHRFKKSLGQNFLSDTNLLRAIARDAGVAPTDTVLEIGAGAGTLTAILCESAGKVVSYEVDSELVPRIQAATEGKGDFTLRLKDFMEESEDELLALSPFYVVANLPYYITTPVLMRLLESKAEVKGITIMVQKEVAERIVASPGSKNYSALSLAAARFGNAKISRAVPRTMFCPPPNVDSAVVVLTPEKRYFPKNEAFFARLCRAAFAMRRKTLCNNVQEVLGIRKEITAAALQKMGLSATVRGETLSAQQLCDLSDLLCE